MSDSILSLGLAEQFELVVESPGRVTLPPEVRTALGLKPGDLFTIERNTLSLRLESYREMLADWGANSLPDRWSNEFFQRPQTTLEGDGALPIASGFLPLAEGDRLILEVVTKGLSHELFLYRAED